MIFTCKTCQSSFDSPPSRRRQYCSPTCQKNNPEWRANIGRGGRLSNKLRREGVEFLFTCKVCGKQFKDFPCKKRNYCSTECMLKDPEIRIKSSISNKLRYEEQLNLPPRFETFICKACGKSYQARVFSSRSLKRMYCSRRCQRYNTLMKCETCGKEYLGSTCDNRKFCSRQCTTLSPRVQEVISGRVTKYWEEFRLKNGTVKVYDYPNEFRTHLREKIRKLYNNKCIVCGRGKPKYKVVVHHIDHDKNNCDEKNLTLLCYPCNCKAKYDMERWTKLCIDKIAEMKQEPICA